MRQRAFDEGERRRGYLASPVAAAAGRSWSSGAHAIFSSSLPPPDDRLPSLATTLSATPMVLSSHVATGCLLQSHCIVLGILDCVFDEME